MTDEQVRKTIEKYQRESDEAVEYINKVIAEQEMRKNFINSVHNDRQDLKNLLIGCLNGILITSVFALLIWVALQFSVVNTYGAEIDMQKIMMIESSGDPNAWNTDDDSIGLFQITPIVLTEWNNFHPHERYVRDDLFKPQINGRISRWYMMERIPQMLKHYGFPDTARNRIWAYNCGIKCVIDNHLPPITARYFEKYGVADDS